MPKNISEAEALLDDDLKEKLKDLIAEFRQNEAEIVAARDRAIAAVEATGQNWEQFAEIIKTVHKSLQELEVSMQLLAFATTPSKKHLN